MNREDFRYFGGQVSRRAVAVALLAIISLPEQVTAQSVDGAEQAQGDILVTARRKEERLLDTPIAISAITGDEINARRITSLQDLAQNIPGSNVINQASNGGRSDRSFQAVVLRGVSPSASQLQTASVFIDGVPVASASALQTITAPERVEVLKGPQSAYFGRQTFAGAINIVNKLPSDELTADLSGLAGSRANYDATIELSGPLLGDALGFRATTRAYGKHGSYRNAADAGQTLGDQSTKTGSLLLVARPLEGLTIKAFGLLTDNKDGAPAQGLISAYDVDDANGALVVPSQSNCIVNGNPFFCGRAPGLSSATPAQTTSLSQATRASIRQGTNKLLSASDSPDGLGLVSRNYHIHLSADWKLGDTGLTLSSNTGWNHERFSELADLDNIGPTNFAGFTALGGYNFLFMIDSKSRDFSQELRATFENGGPFHATLGASYLNARSKFGNGSSVAINLPLSFATFGASGSKTYGAFFGVGYDLTSQITVNIDGRYQIDKLASYAGPGGTTVTNAGFGVTPGFYAENEKFAGGTYKNFVQRAIVQFKPDTNNMVYASYSKGVNPGAFNTGLLTSTQQAVDIALANKIGVIVDPEKLDNYEIGFKGLLFGKRLRYEVSAYFENWTHQINQQAFTYLDGTGTPQQLLASTNTGHVHIKGLEASLGYTLTKGLTLDVAGALTDSKIKDAVNANATALTGITDFSGNQMPLTSKWSGTAALQYLTSLGTSRDLDGLARIDATYKSGAYTNVANIVKGPDVTNVNATLGVQNDTFSLQAYVTNVFNSKAYYSVGDSVLIDPSFAHFTPNSALIAQLRELRTFGLRGSVKF